MLHGLDSRPGRFAHPRPGRAPPPIWDPPPPTPPGWDHERQKMRTPPPVTEPVQPASSSTARPVRREAPVVVASSLSSADLPLRAPQAKAFKGLGGCRQYACSEASSDGSKWKKLLPQAKGLASKGLLKNDISNANENTAGVCITRAMSLPAIPPPAQQEAIVKYLKRTIRRCEKEDSNARQAAKAQQKMFAKPMTDQEMSGSEVLPKHQRKTAGKPAICRKMDSSYEAMAEMMNAEDSHFTSEYRSHGWWKTVMEGQRHELKEHVRPYDGWTMFRDRAAEVNKCARFPINTY